MNFTPYVLPVLIAAIVSTSVPVLAWRRRSAPGAVMLALLGIAVTIWSFGYAMELASTTRPLILAWIKFEYIGIVAVPATWLAFALNYTGHERWLNRISAAVLITFPLITLLLAWTNDYHDLIWRNIRIDETSPHPMFDPDYGMWFWVHTVFSYLAIGAGTFLLLRSALRSPTLYRRQVLAVVVSAILPWVGNMFYILELGPWPYLDLTPVAFTLSGISIAFGLLRYQLLDVVPVTRDLIFESMSDGVFVLDDQDRVVDLNRTIKLSLNLPDSEIVGKPADRVFARWPYMVERYRNTREITEEIAYDQDDTRYYYDLRISPLYNHRGRFRGRLVVLRDITALKQTEDALRRQNEELTALHATTLGLIDRRDPQHVLEGIVTRSGALVGTAHGYLYVVDPVADELVVNVGTGIFTNYVGWRLKRGQGLSGQVWETGTPLAVEDYYRWGGRHFDLKWLHAVVGIPIRSGTAVIGVLGLAYQEQHRTFGDEEIALLERFGHMASLVLENARLYAEIQQELAVRRHTEAELYRAKDAAEAANRAKSTFLANMSHELRTPLTIILGYSQLLQAQVRDHGYTELLSELEAISSSGDHLLSLISGILDLSKIEAGKMELDLAIFDVADLINDLAIVIRPMIETGHNTLHFHINHRLGRMCSDATKVRQILFNLLSNAAKFTEQGTVTLTAAREQGHTIDWIVFCITDTGVGISVEQKMHLFKEFTQADSSSTRRHSGTGLGLAITHRFCQMMGGQISVESEVGCGSTFTVRLPADVKQNHESVAHEEAAIIHRSE